jgi:hypothetical protein
MTAKILQVSAVVVLSISMVPYWGVLGAAAALVISDLVVQIGVLAVLINRKILKRPLTFIIFMLLVGALIISVSWLLGLSVKMFLPVDTFPHFMLATGIWTVLVGGLLLPLANARLRAWLDSALPR